MKKSCHLQQYGWNENIMISEISHQRKTNTLLYHLFVDAKPAELIETE